MLGGQLALGGLENLGGVSSNWSIGSSSSLGNRLAAVISTPTGVTTYKNKAFLNNGTHVGICTGVEIDRKFWYISCNHKFMLDHVSKRCFQFWIWVINNAIFDNPYLLHCENFAISLYIVQSGILAFLLKYFFFTPDLWLTFEQRSTVIPENAFYVKTLTLVLQR